MIPFPMTNDKIRDLMRMAYRAAELSPDPSTQNGVILLTTSGVSFNACNEFPDGVEYTDERWKRPTKYDYIEHAERNAIYSVAQTDRFTTYNATMVACWASCADCARAIVQSGVSRLIRHMPPEDEAVSRWKDSIVTGDIILREGSVEIVDWEESFPEVRPIRRDGKLWQP